MTSEIFTVSKFTRKIKLLLEETYPFIWITGEISNFLAQTGAPARARMLLIPIVLKKVLLPAILGPVMMMMLPVLSMEISLLILSFGGINGWPIDLAFKIKPSFLISGRVHCGWLCCRLAKVARVSISPIASNHR